MNHKQFLESAFDLALGAGVLFGTPAHAADTIKVGVLHSLSGTMAVSEAALKNTALMAIEEINAKGGLLGKNSNRWRSIRRRTGCCSPRRRAS